MAIENNMAEGSLNFVGRFNNLSGQPAIRQIGLLLGLAGSVALGLGLVQWAMEPDFLSLYGDLSPAASAEIVQSLESNGTRYKVNGLSGLISVPADQVHEVRLKLAGDGLPTGGGAGFDMLYAEQEMGVSSFMEKARFDRALEHELSSTIASLDSVRSARVHLALPKASAFVRKKNKPAASVLLSLYAGRELSERQLSGVVHLIAFSVPGLEAEQVSVVDNRGKLLTSQSNNDDFAYTKEQFVFARQLEKSYVDRITNILTPILGIGAVRASVMADVDFKMVEQTSEFYSPETRMRSEQLIEEKTEGGGGASGIPGTLSNQPPAEVAVSSGVQESSEAPVINRSNKREIRNFELDKTISHTREVPGTLLKLSVAVVVDFQDGPNGGSGDAREPLAVEKLSEIEALVKEAVGYNEARGDTINVVNASFVTTPELEALPPKSLLEQEWVWRAAKLVLVGGGIFLLIFTVLKPLMQASSVASPARQLAISAAQPGMASSGTLSPSSEYVMGDDQVTLGHQQPPGLSTGNPAYQQQLNMARSMVEGEPERVAHVVKGWVATDG